MNIGFDLDKVLIDYPPFIPSWVIDKLYKKKDNGVLLYRIPGRFEQLIRILSHHPLLRPMIQNNLTFVRKISQRNGNRLFLISSRFDFLKGRTNAIIKKEELDKVFHKLYFNYKNQQPHVFKDIIIKKEQIKKYVDDDLSLLRYLSINNPQTHFYWLNPLSKAKISKNLFGITNISQML